MSGKSAGITAGILAGAAGATALNATTYLDQLIRGDAATSSPAGAAPARAAGKLADAAGVDLAGPQGSASSQRQAAGSLGGLGIGVAVGALAGGLRGVSTTPPRPLAAAAVGLAAMAAGNGIALATHTARPDWKKPATLLRDLVPHVVYGAVAVLTLHRLLDPRTEKVSR